MHLIHGPNFVEMNVVNGREHVNIMNGLEHLNV